MRRARNALAVSAAAALCTAAVPGVAFGQASASDGSAAQEYGDYVPSTSGTSTPKHATTPKHTSAPRHAQHAAPAPRYVPPVRHYTAPATRPAAPVAPRTATPAAPAAARHAARHRARRHRPHHAAAVHRAAKPAATTTSSKQHVSVPAAPSASVDGGSRQLILLGLAMLATTVAVFFRAGWQKRHGSA